MAYSMTVGVGTDICNIERIEKSFARYGEALCARILTANEYKQWACLRLSQRRTAFLAKRFAAKEATLKALASVIGKNRISWKNIEVYNRDDGLPALNLSSCLQARLRKKSGNGTFLLLLSLADDKPLAQAFVTLQWVSELGLQDHKHDFPYSLECCI